MSPKAKELLEQLVRAGKAPASDRKATEELIGAGLAKKAKSGLAITPAGTFAAAQRN